jgi:hypothetical protein
VHRQEGQQRRLDPQRDRRLVLYNKFTKPDGQKKKKKTKERKERKEREIEGWLVNGSAASISVEWLNFGG